MLKIHKEVFGEGKPIVLLHGWAMHTGVWRVFALQLSQHYQVTCIDLPGHGLSNTIEPFSLESIAEALIKEMPDSPFCLLGWSLGATVALAITNNYPQKINSLILLAGNPCFVKKPEWSGVDANFLEEFLINLCTNYQLAVMRFLSLQVKGLLDERAILKTLKQAFKTNELATEKVLVASLKILMHSDLRQQLASVQCPINIIQGDLDILIPYNISNNIKKIQPSCDVNIITGAGHVPFLSHQDQVINLIDYFLTETK